MTSIQLSITFCLGTLLFLSCFKEKKLRLLFIYCLLAVFLISLKECLFWHSFQTLFNALPQFLRIDEILFGRLAEASLTSIYFLLAIQVFYLLGPFFSLPQIGLLEMMRVISFPLGIGLFFLYFPSDILDRDTYFYSVSAVELVFLATALTHRYIASLIYHSDRFSLSDSSIQMDDIDRVFYDVNNRITNNIGDAWENYFMRANLYIQKGIFLEAKADLTKTIEFVKGQSSDEAKVYIELSKKKLADIALKEENLNEAIRLMKSISNPVSDKEKHEKKIQALTNFSFGLFMKESYLLLIFFGSVLLMIFYGNLPNVIAPSSSWSTIIKGKWKYECRIENDGKVKVLSGKAFYSDSLTFKKSFTLKQNIIKSPKILAEATENIPFLFRRQVGEGKVMGSYNLKYGSQIFNEQILYCQIDASELNRIPADGTQEICNLLDQTQKTIVHTFTRNKIYLVTSLNNIKISHKLTKINN